MAWTRRDFRFVLHCGAVVLLATCSVSHARAAWLGFKNNTSNAVVIQSSDLVIVNGQVKQVRPAKPHTLYPGEVAWDPIAAPGIRAINVYDPKANNRVLLQEKIECGKVDIVLSLQMVSPPSARNQPPLPAQPRLIPTVLTPNTGGPDAARPNPGFPLPPGPGALPPISTPNTPPSASPGAPGTPPTSIPGAPNVSGSAPNASPGASKSAESARNGAGNTAPGFTPPPAQPPKTTWFPYLRSLFSRSGPETPAQPANK